MRRHALLLGLGGTVAAVLLLAPVARRITGQTQPPAQGPFNGGPCYPDLPEDGCDIFRRNSCNSSVRCVPTWTNPEGFRYGSCEYYATPGASCDDGIPSTHSDTCKTWGHGNVQCNGTPNVCGDGLRFGDEQCDYREPGYASAGVGVYCKDEEAGPCCTSSCRLTQCSDGIDNDGDGNIDAEDIACACEDCAIAVVQHGGQTPQYDPAKNAEYDACSDPAAPPAGASFNPAFPYKDADPNGNAQRVLDRLWASLVAANPPVDKDPEECFRQGQLAVKLPLRWRDGNGVEHEQDCMQCLGNQPFQNPGLTGRSSINTWVQNACNQIADTHVPGAKEKWREFCVTVGLCQLDPQQGPTTNTDVHGTPLTAAMGGSPAQCYVNCVTGRNWNFPGTNRNPDNCRARCILTYCPLPPQSSSSSSSQCPWFNPGCMNPGGNGTTTTWLIDGGAGGTDGGTGTGSSLATSASSAAGSEPPVIDGGQTGTPGPPSASSAGESGPASRKSAASSSARSPSSRSSIAPSSPGLACPANACLSGGNDFCAAQDMRCTTVPGPPCFACLPRSASSAASSVRSSSSRPHSSSVPGIVCPADSCAAGGTAYCREIGQACQALQQLPCFACVPPVLSSSVSSRRSSALSSSSVLTVTFSTASMPASSRRSVASAVPVSSRSSAAAPLPSSVAASATPSSPVPTPLPETLSDTDVLAEASVCGDGRMQDGEECDDGNRRDFDGCSADCLLERGYCGDGTVQTLLGEQCEPAMHAASLPYGCSAACRFVSPTCGDTVIDRGEQCDLGRGNSDAPNAHCRSDCGLARCGDGILDTAAENCDDGNRVNGDGCSATCRSERPSPPSVLAQVFEFPGIRPTITPSQPPTMHLPPIDQTWRALPPQTTASGPGALAIMAAGAAAGLGWIRRRR